MYDILCYYKNTFIKINIIFECTDCDVRKFIRNLKVTNTIGKFVIFVCVFCVPYPKKMTTALHITLILVSDILNN